MTIACTIATLTVETTEKDHLKYLMTIARFTGVTNLFVYFVMSVDGYYLYLIYF